MLKGKVTRGGKAVKKRPVLIEVSASPYVSLYRGPWSTANIRVTDAPSAGSIRGRIVDASGAASVGTSVSVEATALSGVELRTVTTGKGGKFTVGGLAAGKYRVFVPAAAPRKGAVSKVVTAKVGSKVTKVGTLRRAAVGGATVTVVPTPADTAGVDVQLQTAAGVAVEDGFASVAPGASVATLSFANLPVGRYRLAVVGRNAATAPFTVTAGQVTAVPSLSVPIANVLVGQVTPIEAYTTERPTHLWHSYPYTIDSNGTRSGGYDVKPDDTFTIDNLGPGDHKVFIAYWFEDEYWDEDDPQKPLNWAVRGAVRVTLPSTGAAPTVKVPLVRVGSAQGRVIDRKTKKGISGVKVIATRVIPTGDPLTDRVEEKTDAKGKYGIGGLAAGVKYKFAFASDGVYRTTWYGGATDVAKAKTVSVKSAQLKDLKSTAMSR